MKQKISLPKRLGQVFWFLKPFMKWNFSFAKGPCILVFKMRHIFFLSFDTLWAYHEKRKKKKKEPPCGALCWVMLEE